MGSEEAFFFTKTFFCNSMGFIQYDLPFYSNTPNISTKQLETKYHKASFHFRHKVSIFKDSRRSCKTGNRNFAVTFLCNRNLLMRSKAYPSPYAMTSTHVVNITQMQLSTPQKSNKGAGHKNQQKNLNLEQRRFQSFAKKMSTFIAATS